MEIILILTFLFAYMIPGFWLFSHLEKKGIIPKKYHPYTKKKSKKLFWDFMGLYFLFFASVLTFVAGHWKISAFLLLFLVLNFGAIYLIRKNEIDENGKTIEIEFDEEDRKEWETYRNTEKSRDAKKSNLPPKIVFSNDYLYLSKYRKILIRERMYKYIFLSSIKKEDDLLILKYGFMGIPTNKIILFIPKRKKAKMLELYRTISVQKETNPKDFYMELFKKKSR